MNAVVQNIEGELLVDGAEFFAPMASDLVDGLVGQYQQARGRIEKVAEIMAGELGTTVGYFMDGNKSSGRDSWYKLDSLFSAEGAIKALNSDFWNRALRLTDVLDCMPQKRRDEWFQQIREHQCPDFEEETVRSTLQDLLAMRGKFFAERVDGLFRSLSRSHVTNRPEGFSKRMIIAGALSSYGTVEHSRAGLINDLRCVVAKFMGRDEPGYNATDSVIRAAKRNSGEWMPVDGGALRIRVYAGVGTAHLEVHPDMAWRLNAVLASLYPAAIPSQFRTKPKRKLKEFALMQRPLPFAVVELLAGLEEALEPVDGPRGRHHRGIPLTRHFRGFGHDKAVLDEAGRVLEAIGGVRERRNAYEFFRFDYEPQAVLDEIVCSGCIPDRRSHQFYPTPEGLAQRAVALAAIGEHDTVLEPSAGIGGLADLLPVARTTCVEVSALHAAVLKAKGFHVEQADFLKFSCCCVDRVVMNPPFDQGRWQAHLEHAASLLKPGGRLVAILPAGAHGKDVLPGWVCTWEGPFDNEFAGASVSVVILVAQRGPN